MDNFGVIWPGRARWIRKIIHDHSIIEYFEVDNRSNDQAVVVLGFEEFEALVEDPCSFSDPYETLFPWEGSCETDWWSEDLWDDVIPE